MISLQKVLYISILSLNALLGLSNLAFANECSSFLTNFDTKTYDPVEVLKKAGLDPDRLSLRFVRVAGGEEAPSIELTIYYQSEDSSYKAELGGMTAWAIDISFDSRITYFTKWSEFNIWRTDTSKINIQGVGLGQLMYLIMATQFYTSYPKKHLISTDHSGSANDMWEALVRKGFASKFSVNSIGEKVPIQEELGTIYEINKNSINRNLKEFVKAKKQTEKIQQQ